MKEIIYVCTCVHLDIQIYMWKNKGQRRDFGRKSVKNETIC